MYASVVLRIAWICRSRSRSRSRSRTRAGHVYFHVMGLVDMWTGGAAAVVFACQLLDRVPSALIELVPCGTEIEMLDLQSPVTVIRPYIISAVKRYKDLSYHGVLSLMYKVSFKIREARVESRESRVESRESSHQPPDSSLQTPDFAWPSHNQLFIRTSNGMRAINKPLPRLIPRHAT